MLQGEPQEALQRTGGEARCQSMTAHDRRGADCD